MVAVKQHAAHGVMNRSERDQEQRLPVVLSGLCFHGNLARPSLQFVPAQDWSRDQRACQPLPFAQSQEVEKIIYCFAAFPVDSTWTLKRTHTHTDQNYKNLRKI